MPPKYKLLYWGFMKKAKDESLYDKLGNMECQLAALLTGSPRRDELFEFYYAAVAFVEEYGHGY
jgi:hypothetical protein